MKKKLFLLAICLLLVAFCLVGCSGKEAISTVNKLRGKSYSSVNLTVIVSTADDDFESTFNVTYQDEFSYTVEFDIKRLATFEGDIPDSFLESYVGVATVQDEKVVSVTGNLPDGMEIKDADGHKLIFSDKTLTNVKDKDGVFTAKVSNPKGFMGQTNFACKANSMSVRVNYTSRALTDIRIQYTSTSGNRVVLLFTYTL